MYTATHDVNEGRASKRADVSFKSKTCVYCNDKNHRLWDCVKFGKESLHRRWSMVKNAGLCYNCLRKNHVRESCKETNRCAHCKSRHHSLLHRPKSTCDNMYKERTSQSAPGNKKASCNVNTESGRNESRS